MSAGALDRGLSRDAGLFHSEDSSAIPGTRPYARDVDRPYRRQLREHPDGQAVCSPRTRGPARTRSALRSHSGVSPADPADHADESDRLDQQQLSAGVGGRRGRVALVVGGGHARRRRARGGTRASRRRDVRLRHVDFDRHLRQRRAGAGRHADDRAAARPGGPDGRARARRFARRDPVRERALPLWQGRRRDRRPVALDLAGRKGRPGRALRLWQVDAGQPALALLRRRGRPHPDRWAGHREP